VVHIGDMVSFLAQCVRIVIVLASYVNLAKWTLCLLRRLTRQATSDGCPW